MLKYFTALLIGLILPHSLRADDLGPYQMILDKQLLGVTKVAPVVSVAPPPTLAAPLWSNEYRMTMITQDDDKMRVGLQNLKTQSAVLLIEGEEVFPGDEFQLVSGDYLQGMAVIRYRGSEHRFHIESGPVPVQVAPEKSSGNSRGRGRSTRTSPRSFQPESIRPSPPKSSSTPVPPRRVFKSNEELQAHLQKQNMDAIRTGKPPLPIALTPENDKQLVKEGVLSPQ